MIKDSFGQRHSSHGSIHRKLKELFRILLTLLHWVFSQMNIKTHPENIFKVISVCVSTTISLVQAYSSEFWTENPRCVIFFLHFISLCLGIAHITISFMNPILFMLCTAWWFSYRKKEEQIARERVSEQQKNTARFPFLHTLLHVLI